jgi:hypothetical protein
VRNSKGVIINVTCWIGGVRAGGIFGAGSLILIPVAFLSTTFFAFRDGVGVVAALCLLAHVEGAPALAPPVEVLAESALGARAET